MSKEVVTLAVLSLTLFLSACGGDTNSGGTGPLASVLPDKMAGCYAVKRGKPADFKVEKEDGQYYAAFRKKDDWKKENEPLVEMSSDDLMKAIKSDADKVDMALMYQKGAFALFKFKNGAVVKKKDPASDYMAVIFIGGGPVYRTDCTH